MRKWIMIAGVAVLGIGLVAGPIEVLAGAAQALPSAHV
jgi:hypothetical protein